MTPPDLHGYAPASVLARRLGVSPSTIRRRASRGLLDVWPSPFGSGALYREKVGGRGSSIQDDPGGFLRVAPALTVALRRWSRLDAVILSSLPGSTTAVARQAGCSVGTADRRLRRLEGWGMVSRRGGVSGPRGGRPPIEWSAA